MATALLLLFVLFIYLYSVATIKTPGIKDKTALGLSVRNPSKDYFTIGRNKLRKSESGLWEMYIEGKPFDRGVIIGKLSSKLIFDQEIAFVKQIKKIIPSDFYLNFLKYFVAWFNRDLDENINKEFLEEIYGISQSASEKFSYISDNYQRLLNYHGAHDIGHALQGLNMVGCTSFSVWGNKSSDSSLLVGRNFDFYVGDEFSKNKIVCFYKPDGGYPFMIVSWGGMIGAVSGMNMKGLTVTINAAKSDIPYGAKTPISILAREILQYASTIDEAFDIAKKREIFVSESIMIGSAKDNRTAIIEKTPYKMDIFNSKSNEIICSNHFQSNAFINDKINLDNKKNSSSIYRYNRTKELIDSYSSLDYKDFAAILRDRYGLSGKDIGMGNEKSINQLIAHHSVIFKPNERIVWVSTAPYQLGMYVAYNLDSIFNNFPGMVDSREIYQLNLNISPDSFIFSKEYMNFKKFRFYKVQINDYIRNEKYVAGKKALIEKFISLNPELYLSYSLAGGYYSHFGRYREALNYYNMSLKKEIASSYEKKGIYEKILEMKKELK